MNSEIGSSSVFPKNVAQFPVGRSDYPKRNKTFLCVFSACNAVWIGQNVQNEVSVERSIFANLLFGKSSVKGLSKARNSTRSKQTWRGIVSINSIQICMF